MSAMATKRTASQDRSRSAALQALSATSSAGSIPTIPPSWPPLPRGGAVPGASRRPSSWRSGSSGSPTRTTNSRPSRPRKSTLRADYKKKLAQAVNLDALQEAARAGAAVRDAARKAAAQQGRNGRPAVRHQPGRPGPQPAVRAVPPGPGERQGVLRRAADRGAGDRPLPRHGLVRGRHRQPVAHRDPEQPRHHAGQGRHR